MTDADEIRRQGQQLAAMDARLGFAEEEITKLRERLHKLNNDAAPMVMGWPARGTRLDGLETRVAASEARALTLASVELRMSKVEEQVIGLKREADLGAAAGERRRDVETWAIRVVTALLIAGLVAGCGWGAWQLLHLWATVPVK